MRYNLRYFNFLIVVIFLHSCATFQIQKDEKIVTTRTTKDKIQHTFYLIGDVGNASQDNLTLVQFKKHLDNATENSTAIFLGDNIYPKGFNSKTKESQSDSEIELDLQLDAVKDYDGKTIFIPGNHDWYSGLKGLKEQEKYIEDKLGKNTFLPEDGCSIEKVEINDDLTLLIIDTHWYITNWDKHPYINDDCKYRNRADFLDELESEIKKARGKTTLISMHHPMFSDGPHGGQFSFASHLKPIPVLGSLKNLIRKTGGIIDVDIQNKNYRELQERLVTLAQHNDKVIFVSGHEHSLQYLIKYGIPQIVSGSGSKKSPTRQSSESLFSYGANGFAVLDVYEDGSSFIKYYEKGKEDPVFQTIVFSKDKRAFDITQLNNFPKDTMASVYTSEEVQKSNFYKFLWGERYRSSYGKKVKVNTVNLDTIFGGVFPVRKGGGNQSKSLRLEDKQGRQYVMRALRKQSTQYLQAAIFKNQFIGESLDDDFTSKLLTDGFTGAHPYAPFVVGDLADAVGIYHTNPKLYYVPKQLSLGDYNTDFGDELYMIEEHTSEGHDDKASFGFRNNLISTHELMKEIAKDEDIVIDEGAYIKARLFDMLIGDWDRHNDQWRWIEFEEKGKSIYRPMPRDRDQAFSKMSDGFILTAAVKLFPGARLLRSYSEDLVDVKGVNVEPFPIDMALILQSEKHVWDQQVKLIKDNVTDEVIENAFKNNIPKEIQNEDVEEIIRFLKARRENLQKISDRYFEVLNKFAVIKGTNKDDWFDIERLPNGKTKITAYRIIGGEKADIFHERTYSRNSTKEIWIYALDDKDYLKVYGNGDKQIKIRLIGGLNNDTYEILNKKKIKIYDFKSKKNTFLTKGVNKRLTDDYETNVYHYKKPKSNLNQILPAMGFNPDDGLKFGVTNTLTQYNFERNPFSSKHTISAFYFLATNGFELNYSAEFANVLKQANFKLDFQFNSPNYAVNFFGFGNSTPNPEAEDNDNLDVDMDYNRVKLSTFKIAPSLVWKGHSGSYFQAGVSFESNDIERTSDRFIDLFPPNSLIFESQNFIGAKANYKYEVKDDGAFPTLGMSFSVEAGTLMNTETSKGFGYVIPEFGIVHKLTSNEKLVLATKVRSHINFNNNFEFYQAAVLGDETGLRGFRRERFSGQQAFVHSTDLRLNFKKGNTFSPINFGMFGGFDYGRVWIDDEFVQNSMEFNKNEWNTSYGGGVFVVAYGILSANVSTFFSDDGLRFSFRLGFGF